MGVFDAETIDIQKTDYGKARTVRNLKNVSSTNKIPAELGIEFGLVIMPISDRSQKKLTLKEKWISPEVDSRTPKNQKIMRVMVDQLNVEIGKSKYTGLQFLEKHELITGRWVHQLWYQGEMLSNTTFEVYRPHDLAVNYNSEFGAWK